MLVQLFNRRIRILRRKRRAMDIKRYLERIQFNTSQIRPDYITLETLVENHQLHIPFENIDIQNRIPIHLDADCFYDKIIVNKKGGYCYELNGLFYELLKGLGYDVMMVSGRIARGNYGFGAEFGHMALIVNIDEVQWLVDVGFGDFSMRPLAMLLNEVQSDSRTQYRIADNIKADGRSYYSVEKFNLRNHTFKTQYLFSIVPRQLSDYEEMNHYQQTSADSHFTRNYLCSRPTSNGRVSIVNNRLYKTIDGHKAAFRIENEEQRNDLLQRHFGIRQVCETSV